MIAIDPCNILIMNYAPFFKNLLTINFAEDFNTYLRDSRQEFAKVGGIFPIFHAVVLLDSSN